MDRPISTAATVAAAFLMGAGCFTARVPDVSSLEAAEIISRAPEFNQYARVVKVEHLDHLKGSMDRTTMGEFTFQYLKAPADAALIEASVELRYHEGKWWLNGFSYGCPSDCHSVDVFDGPDKRK